MRLSFNTYSGSQFNYSNSKKVGFGQYHTVQKPVDLSHRPESKPDLPPTVNERLDAIEKQLKPGNQQLPYPEKEELNRLGRVIKLQDKKIDKLESLLMNQARFNTILVKSLQDFEFPNPEAHSDFNKAFRLAGSIYELERS